MVSRHDPRVAALRDRIMESQARASRLKRDAVALAQYAASVEVELRDTHALLDRLTARSSAWDGSERREATAA